MKKFLTFMLMLMLSTTFALAKKNLKVLVVTPTPQMQCVNCQNKIKKNLRFLKGIKDIETSLEKQTVTITYDADKITPEVIMKNFETFGYTVKEVKKGDGKSSCCGAKSGGCSKQGASCCKDKNKKEQKKDCCSKSK